MISVTYQDFVPPAISAAWLNGVDKVASSAIAVNTTVAVPSQFATVQAAMSYLSGLLILAGVVVNITVADGTYTLTSSVNLNHPQGGQINLTGNVASPANVTFITPGLPSFDAFFIGSGHQFGTISGIKVDLPVKALAATNFTAFLAVDSAQMTVANCLVNNWYYSVAARDGAEIFAHDITASNAGDVAFWSFSGSTIRGSNLQVTSASDATNSLGYGFQGEYGGVIDVSASSATGCLRGGFAALSNGTGRYLNCTANANTGSGFFAQGGGVIEANGSSSTNNTRYGIEFFGAGTCTGLSTNTGNALGTDNGMLSIDQGNLGARLVSNGDMRIDVNGANNWFFNSSGGVQMQVKHTAGSVAWAMLTGGASSPFISSAGAATNIDMNLQGKGTGSVFLGNNAANYLRVNPTASGTAPQLRAEGVDVDIDLLLGGKGAGLMRFGAITASADAAMSGYITIKDAGGSIRKLMVTP